MLGMQNLAVLLIHLIATVVRSLGRGGARSIVAESLLLKHQLLILNRGRERAPNLQPIDRMIAGLCAGWLRPARLLRSAIVLKPSTIMPFHRALVKQKYRSLFTPKHRGKPGPKGTSAELIDAIVEMKHRNPLSWLRNQPDTPNLVLCECCSRGPGGPLDSRHRQVRTVDHLA